MVSTQPRPSVGAPAQHDDQWPAGTSYEMVLPWLAGLTVVCSATALAGVISRGNWLGYVALTVLVVVCAGLTLRALRSPTVLVALGQMFAIACLSTLLFTRDGVAGLLPGPGALAELGRLLTKSVEVIRSGVPPVDATAPILCLAVISIGLVSVIVDILVAPGQAPAAAGLMLLCVYAVPASLSDEMLPWWTFALGAASFALLLAVDRAYRQRAWSGRAGSSPVNESGPTAAAIAGVAMVVALLAGTQLSAIGTEGRLPGTDGGSGSSGPSQLGIKPFTTLRGMLDAQEKPVELFRVRGLGADAPYLRSLTLRDYRPNEGWRASKAMARGVAAGTGRLPAGPGDGGTEPTRPVRIEAMNWLDVWLPVYGIPRQLRGVANGWRYDNSSGIVYSQRARNPGSYTEQAMLAEPSPRQLRAAPSGGSSGVDPSYTRVSGVNPRVVALTRRLTAKATNNFDKAVALYRYFTVTGGFTYDTRTSPATDSDALADFVLKGKTGFCEQYASSMAVMLRAIGVPSRVAIGFTPGQQKNGYRSITSQDAHAWVEVFFPGHGWQTFDPTPLTDGRTYTPSYLNTHSEKGSPDQNSDHQLQDNQSRAAPAPAADKPDTPDGAAATAGQAPNSGVDPLVLAIVALTTLGTVCTVFAVLRRRRPSRYRNRHLDRLGRLLTPLAGLCWLLAVLLTVGRLSWWLLAIPIALVSIAAPALVRALVRARRRQTAAGAGPG
ncbi:MAG: transglutaminaseTgpA domain-containing protein, partial [Sciscionella sp.]